MPSPGLCPAPTTMATRSFRRMSIHSRNRVLLQYLFVMGFVVDLHRREYADFVAVEGDRKHESGHVLVAQLLLDLSKGDLRHCEVADHLARASQDRLCQRLQRRWLALGL